MHAFLISLGQDSTYIHFSRESRVTGHQELETRLKKRKTHHMYDSHSFNSSVRFTFPRLLSKYVLFFFFFWRMSHFAFCFMYLP